MKYSSRYWILRNGIAVPTFFLLITLVMTYPLVLHLGTGVKDLGDGLFNSWIMSWDVHEITRFDFRGFFNANIFFPNKRTLAYSEHLFTQSLASLPIRLFTSNPLLVHNIMLLLAFLTSALGMYALARHLTRSRFGGIVAGLIYAFSPFMFSHFVHIQIITAGGIPLCFLFLHRYFETGRTRESIFFVLIASFQALANGYYALYLAFFAGLFILVMAVARKRILDLRFWRDMIAAAAIILALVGPFAYQYVRVGKDMGFSRNIGSPASLTSFLASSPTNRIYGYLTERFQVPEKHLFPGLLAFILALSGFVSLALTRHPPGWGQAPAGGLAPSGGRSPWPEASPQAELSPPPGLSPRLVAVVYGLITLLAFLFTFGPNGPYVLLYKFFPGYNGLRVPARFQIFVMFGIAVLAAFGARGLIAGLRSKTQGKAPQRDKRGNQYSVALTPQRDKGGDLAARGGASAQASRRGLAKGMAPIAQAPLARLLVYVLLPLLIIAEYAAFPIPLESFPPGGQIPQVYRWLAAQKNDGAVLELPLPPPREGIGLVECPRLFYSTTHWHNLVNGYSGFFPPVYDELQRRWREYPVAQNVRDAIDLGVRYLLVHEAELMPESREALASAFAGPASAAREAVRVGDDVVYEFLPTQAAAMAPEDVAPHALVVRTPGWKARASVNDGQASRAIDGDMRTRWSSDLQKSGDAFELDLGEVRDVIGLSLKLGPSTLDYPRGCRIELSPDGLAWTEAVRLETPLLPIREYLRANDISYRISFPRTQARFIRITLTSNSTEFFWSIYEFEVQG